MYTIEFSKKSLKDLKVLNKNKKLLHKAEGIIREISEDPYSSNYKFEYLKHNLSGFCSKQLDKKYRVIYKVVDNEVIVIMVSCPRALRRSVK